MKKNNVIIVAFLLVLIVVGIVLNYKKIFKLKQDTLSTNTEITSNKSKHFEILFKSDQSMDCDKEICPILNKSETEAYNYNIYSYHGSVSIKIDGKEYSLKDALLNNRITMEEIVEKADNDFPVPVSYDDGGSNEYHYDNYTIIKCHTLEGNQDVYIGPHDMTLHDVL